MRIAYIVNSLEGGGGALPIPRLARVMTDWGAEVRIFALSRRDGRALPSIEAAGLACEICPHGETANLRALQWLDAELRRWRPTVLWTSLSRATIIGILLGTLRRIPVVSWQHNIYLKPGNAFVLRLLQPLARLWIADSQSVAELTAQRLRVPQARLMTWPIFSADAQATAASIWRQGEVLRLGCLGRLHPAKGYDVLIQALAQLDAEGFTPAVPFEIHVAGDGALRGELEAMARAAGIKTIHFVGYASKPAAFLAGLHAYIQPSRHEGFCIAAHEAMQAGLPVIASATGEMSFDITDGLDGYLVPPGNAADLARALAKVLRNPEGLHGMGLVARRNVQHKYGADRFAAAGRMILDRLAAQAGPA